MCNLSRRARLFATRLVLERAQNDSERLEFAYRCVLTRSPTSDEQETLQELLADMRAAYQAHPELAAELLDHGDAPVPSELDPRELAAWTVVANTLLNLDEAINQH